MRTPKPQIRDGLELARTSFALPTGRLEELAPQELRDAKVCDLFVNRKLTVADVAKLSNQDYQAVVRTLFKQGIVKDRRQKQEQPPDGIERRQTENEQASIYSLLT